MNMTFKRIAAWSLGIIVAASVVLYGLLFYVASQDNPLSLTVCMEADPVILRWPCKQVLQHRDFNPEHVKELNSSAGARFAMYTEDLDAAEKTLLRFMAQGVDINAVDVGTRNWTALHGAALEGEVAQVKLLLRHGARADMRDTEGLTPLDLARIGQAKHPNEPNRAEVVRILEEAEKTPAERR